MIARGTATLPATTALTGAGTVIVPGTATLAGSTGIVALVWTAALPAAGTMTGTPRIISRATATLAAAGTLTGTGTYILNATTTLPGITAVTGGGVVIPAGVLTTATLRKPVQITAGAIAGDVLTSDAWGNGTWQPPAPAPTTGVAGPFTISGVLSLGGGTSTTGNAPVLTPTFTNGTATRLPDLTRDYWAYLQTSATGTFSVLIGPTSTPASVVFAAASLTSAQLISFRIPAGYWVQWAGTATLTQQKAIGC